jgi:phosphonate transport system substrate-binding protein
MEPADAGSTSNSPSPTPPDSGDAATVAYQRPARRSTNPILLLLFIVVGTAAVAAGLWVGYFREEPVNNTQANLSAAGFSAPVVNKLDPRFTDADGDLLADAPTDPSQLIDPPTIIFSYVAVEEPEKYKEEWKPFTDYLSKAIGKPVEYALLTSAKDELKAMHDGKLHVAGFNTGNVPAAVNVTGFIPVCGIPTAEGTALTHTEIIVPADSPLQKPADLKNHELTFTEPSSNSGYKAPVVLLRSNFGLQPLNDVLPRYSGSHDASIEGIAQKKYEAAAVAADMLAHAVSDGTIKPNQYRTIYTSEQFPTAGLGYVYNLKPELAQKIRDALLNYDWKGTPLEERFANTKQSKFIPVNFKNDWSLIRRIDDEMGVQQKLD